MCVYWTNHGSCMCAGVIVILELLLRTLEVGHSGTGASNGQFSLEGKPV